jgi:hypothetical protein
MSYDMIIFYKHYPHFELQMLKLMNKNNQPNGPKKNCLQPQKLNYVVFKIFIWFKI